MTMFRHRRSWSRGDQMRPNGIEQMNHVTKVDGTQTGIVGKAIGPRTERIVRRILELGDQLEQPDKGQLLIHFADDSIKVRLTVVLPGDP